LESLHLKNSSSNAHLSSASWPKIRPPGQTSGPLMLCLQVLILWWFCCSSESIGSVCRRGYM